MTKTFITCPECGAEIPVTTGVVNKLGRKSYDIDFPIICKALQACQGNYSAAARFITEKTGQKVTPGFVQNRIQRASKTKAEILSIPEKRKGEKEAGKEKGLTIIKTSYVVSGNPELEDKELPDILCGVLGVPFPEFVEITLDKVRKAIKGRCGKHLEVRCHRTKKPKSGLCLKALNMVVVGFCGDIEDLEITLMHELLHLFRWDEKMVEAKAREIQERGQRKKELKAERR